MTESITFVVFRQLIDDFHEILGATDFRSLSKRILNQTKLETSEVRQEPVVKCIEVSRFPYLLLAGDFAVSGVQT